MGSCEHGQNTRAEYMAVYSARVQTAAHQKMHQNSFFRVATLAIKAITLIHIQMLNYNTCNQSLSTFATLTNTYMFYHHQTITIFVTLTNMNCIITTLVIINIFSMCKVKIEALIPLLGNG